MRSVYPALFYTGALMAVETAGAIAQMTHWDTESTEACHLYTNMIYFIINSRSYIGYASLADLEKMLDDTPYGIQQMNGYTPYPTGYVVESMKCAVDCFRTRQSFEDAIVKAVNLGGDADTVGAITGGLAGAYYGYSSIPERWIQALSPEIRVQTDRLVDAAVKNREE